MKAIRHFGCVFVLLLFVLTMAKSVNAAEQIPVYEVGSKTTQLKHFSVGLVCDSTGDMSYEQVMHSAFKVVNSQFSIPSGKHNFWFIIKLKNSGANPVNRIIGFDEVFMEHADIYYETESGVFSEKSGLILPINERAFRNRCPLFNTTIPANDTLVVYLKLHSKFLNTLNLVVEDAVSHSARELWISILHWFYFGAAFSIILYNLFLYFQIREKVYVYYVIYAAGFVFLIFLYSGYSLYIMPSIFWHYKLHVSFAISLATTPVFTQLLLKTKNMESWVHHALTAVTVWYALLAILIIIDISYYQWLVVSGPPASLTVLFVAIYCYYKRVALSGIYLIASSGYLVGLFITALGSLGLITYDSFVRHAFIYGSLFEFILLSLALGRRYKYLQEEKLAFQNRLIATEKEMTNKLESKVEERTRELKLANEKLIELDEFKQGMTGMLVHDLKTPLSSILNIDVIPDEASRKGIIKNSGYKMMHLVQNILDVYKYESTDIELKKSELYFINIINKAVNELVYFAEQKGLLFTIDCSEHIVVNADNNFIHRVLINLLSNAIKFAPKQSTVTIKASCEQTILKLSIHNSGAHIPASKQQYIFEKFAQGEQRAQGNFDSTGLGLAFCKMVVLAHNGKINVMSEEGKGAQFWFTIPNAHISDKSYEESSEDTSKEVHLTDEEKKGLKSIYKDLVELSVFEITAFNKVFKTIEVEQLGNAAWINALQDAIYNCNEEVYCELVELIDGDKKQ